MFAIKKEQKMRHEILTIVQQPRIPTLLEQNIPVKDIT